MDRLAAAGTTRRAGRGAAVRHPRRGDHPCAVDALCACRQSRAGRGAVSGRKGGGAGDCGAGAAADRRTRARHHSQARAGSGSISRVVPARSALPADRARRRRDRDGGGSAAARPARDQAGQGGCCPARPPAAQYDPFGAGMGHDLGRADGAHRADAGAGSRAVADRRVLLAARRRDLRRRLCGASLYGAGGRAGLRLARCRRDGRRAGAGRNHARATDPGDAIRRLPRRLPQP